MDLLVDTLLLQFRAVLARGRPPIGRFFGPVAQSPIDFVRSRLTSTEQQVPGDRFETVPVV